MKSTLLLCALALCGLFTAIPAQAQEYIGGNISYTAPQDADFEYQNSADEFPPAIFGTDYDAGPGFGLVFGKSYDNNLRIEGELSYRRNDLASFSLEGESFNATGDITAISFLFNTYYDLVNPTPFTPYLGAGLGGAYINLDARQIDPIFADIIYSDEAIAFAYQLGGGLAYKLNRFLTLDLGYRYFSTPTLKLKDQEAEVNDFDAPINNFETDYSTHNVSLGLRLAF